MLGDTVNMIEKIIKSPTEIDLSVINQLNEKMVGLKTSINKDDNHAMHTHSIGYEKLVGGNATQADVDALVNKTRSTFEKIQVTRKNVTFVNKRIEDLNARMKRVVAQNDKLFKIRSNVEWMVNKIERCKKSEDCDEGDEIDISQVEKLIADINLQLKTGEEDQQTAEYIGELNKYIASLENYLQESQNTIGKLSSQNLENALKVNEEAVKAHDDANPIDQLGGGMEKDIKDQLKDEFNVVPNFHDRFCFYHCILKYIEKDTILAGGDRVQLGGLDELVWKKGQDALKKLSMISKLTDVEKGDHIKKLKIVEFLEYVNKLLLYDKDEDKRIFLLQENTKAVNQFFIDLQEGKDQFLNDFKAKFKKQNDEEGGETKTLIYSDLYDLITSYDYSEEGFKINLGKEIENFLDEQLIISEKKNTKFKLIIQDFNQLIFFKKRYRYQKSIRKY